MDSFDRLILSVIAALLLAIGVVMVVGDTAGATVQTVSPADGSTPSATTPIQITFNQAMDVLTVQERFSIEPAVEGVFDWDGSTLTFRPIEALQVGRTYTVHLEQGALSDTGRQTKASLSWSFTPRSPAVMYLGPQDDPVRSLWQTDPDQQVPEQVYTTEFGIFDFAISPDGQRVALTVFNESLLTDLWLINADGSSPTQLLDCSPGACASPMWSPDGKVLAYERQDALATGEPGPSRIWLYDLAAATTAPVYEDNQVLGFSPRWSPDGKRLAFFDANSQAIRVVSIGGGDAVVMPSQMGEVGSFSPDGMQMVFTDVREVGRQFFAELWLADFSPDGGLRPALETAEEDQSAVWSPDGQWIVFARRRLDRTEGWGSQMTLYHVQTGEIRTLTDDPQYNNTRFTWSPSGDQILVQRFNLDSIGGTQELWVYTLADGSMIYLTPNGFNGEWLP